MTNTRKTTLPSTITFPPDTGELIRWYRQNGRSLPWRDHGGRAASPYHTWLSEIMLQQTQVITVIPYYQKFIEKWPDITHLANADEQEVLGAWAGLGYYSRARNLLRCARQVTTIHQGTFPDEVKVLKTLSGIGEYTANAIRAIAYDLPANVVDGNVERVITRVNGYEHPLNKTDSKKQVHALAALSASTFEALASPGDYAQALMDLGATICTPRKPACPVCPWQQQCIAHATGREEMIPLVIRKAELPVREADVYVMQDESGRYFLRQRPSKGLLGGLWEFPSTHWDRPSSTINDEAHFPFGTVPKHVFTRIEKPVIHIFTHFRLVLTVYVSKTSRDYTLPEAEGSWYGRDNLPPLPTLTKKILFAAANPLEP